MRKLILALFLAAGAARAAEFVSVIADGRADGSASVECLVKDSSEVRRITVTLIDATGKVVLTHTDEPQFFATADDFSIRKAFVDFDAPKDDVKPWSPESPVLYMLRVALHGDSGELARTSLRMAFRSFEVRREDGLYLNGLKIRLKGVCVKGPSNRAEAQAVKALNANAARLCDASEEFLSACDWLGILAMVDVPPCGQGEGEQEFRTRIRSLVQTAARHPSVVLWCSVFAAPGAPRPSRWWHPENGEGEIRRADPAGREIVRPGVTGGIFDAPFFPPWGDIARRGKGPQIYLPIAALPVCGERGGAAGLEDYWNAICAAPRAAGLFIDWESDASDWAAVPAKSIIRRAFSNVAFDYSNGIATFRNSNFARNLNTCTYEWESLSPEGGIMQKGGGPCPICAPGGAEKVSIPDAPLMRIRVKDASGDVLDEKTFAKPTPPPPHGAGTPSARPAWLPEAAVCLLSRTNMTAAAQGAPRQYTGIFSPAAAKGDKAGFKWTSFGPDRCLMTCTVRRASHAGVDLFGVYFAFDPAKIAAVRKCSAGPESVFANRPASQSWGIWGVAGDDGIPVGARAASPRQDLAKGFFAAPRTVELDTGDGTAIRFTPIDGIGYFGFGAPERADFSHIFPKLGIGFYKTVPAAWSGLLTGGALGPASRTPDVFGEHKFILYIERLPR